MGPGWLLSVQTSLSCWPCSLPCPAGPPSRGCPQAPGGRAAEQSKDPSHLPGCSLCSPISPPPAPDPWTPCYPTGADKRSPVSALSGGRGGSSPRGCTLHWLCSSLSPQLQQDLQGMGFTAHRPTQTHTGRHPPAPVPPVLGQWEPLGSHVTQQTAINPWFLAEPAQCLGNSLEPVCVSLR